MDCVRLKSTPLWNHFPLRRGKRRLNHQTSPSGQYCVLSYKLRIMFFLLHLRTLPLKSFPQRDPRGMMSGNTLWACILNDRKAVPVPSARVPECTEGMLWTGPLYSWSIKRVLYNSSILLPNPCISNSCVCVCNRQTECVLCRTTGEKV